MSKRNLKLETFEKQIVSLKKIKLNEAQDLYRKMINETDNNKKIKIRNDIINSTLYAVLNYLKNSNLDILENGSYDMDDIISATIEFYINEIDNGNLLNISGFSNLFGSTYYTYLSSIFVPQKEDIEISQIIGLDNFGDLMEIFLFLKRNKDEVLFEDYLDTIKKTSFGYRFDEYYFNSLKTYFYKCYEAFQNIYSKVNIDDDNIPSKTKLKFMRHLLIDISLRENISPTMISECDFETEFINNYLIQKSIDYIINDSGLQKIEIDVLIKRNGIEDGERMNLDQVGMIYGKSGERIRQIEAKALRKLRSPGRRQNIYIDWGN